MCGWELMPWQAGWLDVLGEYDPVTGVPYYREGFFTVPRQSGKTSVLLAWALHRCVSQDRQLVAWTAQTGKDARDKWTDEIYPRLASEPIKSLVSQLARGTGNESIRLRTDSVIRLVSNTEDSGHGKTLHAAVLDEVMADVDGRREQAFLPAMSTVADAQILSTSTAGTAASTVYNAKRRAGRAAALADSGEGMAYLEYSAPDGWDPYDEESWWTFMPALGHTIQPPAVRHARQTMLVNPSEGLAGFMRAYGNIPTAGADLVIPAERWELVRDASVSPRAPLTFGVAVAEDRSSASIASADAAGTVELVDARPGTGWLEGRQAELTARHGGSVWVDGSGPAAGMAGCEALPAGEMPQACGLFYDAVVNGAGVMVRQHPLLDAAVTGVAKRTVGDRFVWSRKSSAEDVTPLEAATVAWWAARRDAGRPSGFAYVFGG